MLEIREIFKTIQKYYGLFMNKGDKNSNCIRHSECNEESQSLCNGSGYFANTQYDEIKPVIVGESETIQPIVNQKQLQGNKYAPTSKSKISVLPQGVDMVSNFLAPCGRADLRTDGEKRVRIASRLSTLLRSNMYETLRAWSKFKTGQGEGLKAAFTEPSGGMSGAKVEQTSAETLSFRCVCERCRLMRGEVGSKSRKAAFTLAEVLITLGIIGVVAALTLPTLIQNHQKQVYVTQLKKAYSTINNAFNKMAADEGVVDWNQTYCAEHTYGSFEEIKECYKRLTKQLNILNFKDSGDPCNVDWCRTSAFREGGDLSEYMINVGTFFTTSDGILYIFACGAIDYLLVDINGAIKGPNLAGRDIFRFNVRTDNNKIEPDGAASWNPDAWKNCSATNLSTDCTAKVLIEGKMNY